MDEGEMGKAKKHPQHFWTLRERKERTHQETGMLVFPLVTTQFFSSGLIILG